MSLTPANYDLTTYENADFAQPYQLPSGLIEDFAGYSVRAAVKASYNDAEPLLVMESDLDETGIFILSAAAADLPSAGSYKWDCIITNGVSAQKLWLGKFAVLEGVTSIAS